MALLGKIVQFPLSRIVIAALFVGLSLMGARGLAGSFEGALAAGDLAGGRPLSSVIAVLVALLAYSIYVRVVERRPVEELSATGLFSGLGLGALAGAGLLAATMGAVGLAGCYHVEGVNPWPVLLAPLAVSLASGFIEEIFMRGILFRIMEEDLGTWLALALSALLFGLAHLGNPGAQLLSSLAISLEAGVLLAAAFVLTRKLWLPIGMHFAWNFTQGGIFGVSVSGHSMEGLLRGRLSGPVLLSGGEFGAEASVFAVLICLAAGAWLIVLSLRKGALIQPFWKRSRKVAVVPAAHSC